MRCSKKNIGLFIILMVVLFLITSFVKISGEIRFVYSPSLLIEECHDSDLRKTGRFVFLRKLNLTLLETDNLELIDAPSLKEISISTVSNRDAYLKLPVFENLEFFYSVGLDFKDLSYFSSMDKLRELWLGLGYSDNRIISSYGFDLLPVSLEDIVLNGLENTESLDFSRFSELQSVYICHSSIKKVSVNNENLDYLNLSDNKFLTSIIIGEKTEKLKKIVAMDSPNIQIDADELKKITSLKYLCISKGLLSENDIEKLADSGIEVNEET